MEDDTRYRSMALIGIVIYVFGFTISAHSGSPAGDIEKFSYIYESYFPDRKDACDSEMIKGYVGSGTCKSCHERQFRTWRKYYMSKFVRLKKDARYIPSFTGLPPWYKRKRDDVALTVGGRRHVAVVIKPWGVLPYQYDLRLKGKKGRKWKSRPGWGSVGDYRSICGPCHLTGLDKSTLEFSELGVGCEACHGPGKQHVTDSAKDSIKALKGQNACEGCHFQRAKHIRKFQFSGKFHR